MVCIFCTSNCKDISQQVNVMSVNGTFGRHFEFFPPSCSFHKMETALDIFLVRNGNNWHQIRNSRWPGSVDINIIRIHNIVMTSSLCDVITLLSCKSMKPIIYPMKAGIILVSMVYDTLTHPRWYQSLYFFGPKGTTKQGPQLREDPGRKGPKRGPFSSQIARDGDWGPIFRSNRGPEIWSYATGVDFVFVFQGDAFYPHPSSKRFKFQAKMIQYVHDQDTLEVRTK